MRERAGGISLVTFWLFMASMVPPNLMRGRWYSARMLRLATAREMVWLKDSLKLGSLPRSSAREWMQVILVRFSSVATVSRKVMRFWRESTRVTWISGRAIARGRPGKPAPVPTSAIVEFFGMNWLGVRLSRKCLVITSVRSVMRVRLNFLFHSIKRAKYRSNADICPSVRFIFS